jgi:hypothetical protein
LDAGDSETSSQSQYSRLETWQQGTLKHISWLPNALLSEALSQFSVGNVPHRSSDGDFVVNSRFDFAKLVTQESGRKGQYCSFPALGKELVCGVAEFGG